MNSLSNNFDALVLGSSGGIGTQVVTLLSEMTQCGSVVGLCRSSTPPVDLVNERSIAQATKALATQGRTFSIIFDATGALSIHNKGPEKSLSDIDPQVMAEAFAINSIGPALLFKHFAPLLVQDGKSVFATLSARVGSIGDNRLGGWYAYRASKAALNQVVKTAAIEIARKRPDAVCLALHPGTVKTALTRAYARGRYTHSPQDAARKLLTVIDNATPEQNGQFLAYDGSAIPW